MIADKGKFVFILGGARSGKSSFALKEAGKCEGQKVYIATAEALDEEMNLRIEKHRKERGGDWQTREEPIRIAEAVGELTSGCKTVLLDCLTLWVSNALHKGLDVVRETEKLLDVVSGRASGSSIFMVSNEVGTGIVPESRLAREFRDLAGAVNQMAAAAADEVFMVVAGIPVKIKG